MARLVAAGLALALVVGCGGGSSGSSGGSTGGGGGGDKKISPPIVSGDFTYWTVDQGLSAGIWDVSPDEGGNVYLAAGDAVYAKRRGDTDFIRFEQAANGLTLNCDEKGTVACPVVSVAGAAPGTAIIGLRGVGTDGDYDPDWQLDSGGADVVKFDGAKLTLSRHVLIGGVPHQMCADDSPPPCYDNDPIWNGGRRKLRQVLRMAVEHDTSRVQYGDVWFTGTHAIFAALIANPQQRGWVDLTTQFQGMQSRQYVWEHDHPAMYEPATINGVRQWAFLTGESTAVAIDPKTGDPWAANETRLASKKDYGASAGAWWVPLWPTATGSDQIKWWMDVWPDPDPADPWAGGYDALNPAYADYVSSLSFCADGTLWIASSVHGLARRSPGGAISYVDLPSGLGNNASAVACDPSDGSVWVGFGWGGFGRLSSSGAWWTVPSSAPTFAVKSPVRNIQIDPWTTPRIVYVAFSDSQFGPGGVLAYKGP